MFNDFDRAMMGEALELARRGLFTTHPNPRVGCVLARDTAVVGRGFHAYAGGPHAEVGALGEAGLAAKGATAYVTLEPCSHQGRTAPCADALIAANVARVIYAHDDPNPLVAGKGRQRLLDAGIAVDVGLMRAEARALNPGYLSRHERGRVFLRSKIAISLDGRTALQNGESKWISGESARAEVQHLRARSSAILTGIGTVLRDDPRLDVRIEPGPDVDMRPPPADSMQPARVILDGRLRLPPGARVFRQGGPVHVICADENATDLAGATLHRVAAGPGGVNLAEVMAILLQLEFNEVLVEAGATLNGSLLAAGLVDELIVYMAPHLLGEGGRALANVGVLDDMSQRMDFAIMDVTAVGDDLRLTLKPRKQQA